MKDRGKLSRSLERMMAQLESGMKPDKQTNELVKMSDKDKQRLANEIETLTNRLNGVKKVKTVKVQEDNNWHIEIYSVTYSKLKSSEAKKLRKKGKSTKAVKKQRRSLTLVKTVKNRPGLISSYKYGMEDQKPKNHIFKLVQK